MHVRIALSPGMELPISADIRSVKGQDCPLCQVLHFYGGSISASAGTGKADLVVLGHHYFQSEQQGRQYYQIKDGFESRVILTPWPGSWTTTDISLY